MSPDAFIQLFERGGLLMWPLAFFGIISWLLFVERSLNLTAEKVLPPDFASKILALISERKFDEARAICEHDKHLLARTIHAALKKKGADLQIMKELLQGKGIAELERLKKHISILSTIGYVSPLAGLLGTVLGMIKVFGQLTSNPDSLANPQVLSQGINEALITTAAGLVVAIPAFIFSKLLISKVNGFASEMEEILSEFLARYFTAPDKQDAQDKES